MLIHGFSLVIARLLKAFGTAIYAITRFYIRGPIGDVFFSKGKNRVQARGNPKGTSIHLSQELYLYTVELQWLEHLCNHENMFETGEVRANES